MKHIKLFNETLEYDAFKTSDKYILPNVSFIKTDNKVLYDRIVPEEDMYIEYHLEIPMEEIHDMEGIPPRLYGEMSGDFSELFDQLAAFCIKYGNASDMNNGTNYSVSEDTMLQRSNITINGHRLLYMDYQHWDSPSTWTYPIYGQVDAPDWAGCHDFNLKPDSMTLEHGL